MVIDLILMTDQEIKFLSFFLTLFLFFPFVALFLGILHQIIIIIIIT
jgi:hypothetical protein